MYKCKAYRNAQDILPPELLRELQKYCQGRLWVPVAKRERVKTAGDDKRNLEIARKHRKGQSINALAEETGLCRERIRQIIKQSAKRG